ncbi:hypothetical protein ACFWMU_12580 [Streptomyces sp. NPDC058357]|uniref:hypothetical protein n=1 Tax=unclassified Streptomyces TaxID=2593676 RepID=UPI00364DA856
MTLPPLATTAQLAAHMQVDETALPANAAQTLDMVSAIVRAEARQHFTRGTSTVTLYPADDGTVRLPQRPVVSISAVQRDGEPIPYWRVSAEGFRVRGCEPVSVTFTHGYAETPGDVLAVALTAAQRVLSNPNDLRQETVGAVSVTYAAETIGASLSQADRDLLARYRRTAAMVRTV